MKQATHVLLEEKSHPRLLQHLSSLFHESTNAGGNQTKKKNVYAAKSLLHRFRAIKSPAEISLMRQSCSIAARALNQVAARLPTLGHEYQAAACFEYECKMQGAQRLSYPSVVASGLNALTLHYIRNDNALGRDDLVLMDAGCELHMYSSDISRTYPRSGKYSAAQRLLVDIVLDVQQTVLGYAESRLANYTPLTLHDMHRVSVTQMAKNLCASGVLLPEKSHGVSHEEMVQKYVSKWYPHSIGHHLGIDVHDVQQYEAQGGPLSSGMIVTVEPGLYIGDDADVHPEFRNTGIRIEDDVLIHANGIEVLTHEAVKLPDQIEHLMQQAK
jgi:Xaa-Pro aminopeptidase